MNKYSVQNCLRNVEIKVPKSIMLSNQDYGEAIEKCGLPLYVKSQKQADTIIYTSTEEGFDRTVLELPIKNFYFEEGVDLNEFHLEKIYYVDEYIESSKLDFVITDDLKSILKNISQALNLEIYSGDIFFSNTDDDYRCIDINPAPGLFHSTKARVNFAKYVLHRLKKN